MAVSGFVPDTVLCSTAVRTRETWALVAPALPNAPEVLFEDLLYLASEDEMLSALRAADGDCVMMIGHNPGIGELVAMLPAQPPLDPDFRRFPTAATLVVDFEIADWRDAAFSRASVLDFFVPSGRG